MADDRANKSTHDAQHFEALLREENAKLVKLDQVKKALETEVSEGHNFQRYPNNISIVRFFHSVG